MPERPVQRQYVIDAGALVALERRNQKIFALLKTAAEHRIELVLPSAVLAQVWRDGARQALLSRLLRDPGLVEAPLHHNDARNIGELLRDSGTTDVVDAHVAVLAARLNAPVITSDPDDLTHLYPKIQLTRV
jgi:predicted nucleic acid-binding protein